VFAATVALISCGGGGSSSGGGSAGLSTVQSNVVAVTASLELPGESGSPGKMLATLFDWMSGSVEAQAGLGGVEVTVGGQSGVTDGAGNVVIPNVPPGDQLMSFRVGSTVANLPLTVPPNSVVFVQNVVISGSNASASNVSSTPAGGGNSNDNASGNTNVGGNANDDDNNANVGGNANDDDDNVNVGGNANDDGNDNDDDNDNSGGNSNSGNSNS
jgi:hypothetical protein